MCVYACSANCRLQLTLLLLVGNTICCRCCCCVCVLLFILFSIRFMRSIPLISSKLHIYGSHNSQNCCILQFSFCCCSCWLLSLPMRQEIDRATSQLCVHSMFKNARFFRYELCTMSFFFHISQKNTLLQIVEQFEDYSYFCTIPIRSIFAIHE